MHIHTLTHTLTHTHQTKAKVEGQRQKELEFKRLKQESLAQKGEEVDIEVDESAVEYFAEVEMMQALRQYIIHVYSVTHNNMCEYCGY